MTARMTDGNGFTDDINGWDFHRNADIGGIYGGHGTMVAGILGAWPNNGAGIVGITQNVQIMPLIVCGNDGICDPYLIPKAIHYAADNGANIINMSLGGRYSDSYDEAIRYAYSKGVVIVAAAGNLNDETNFGQDLSKEPRSPVCNDNGQDMVLGVSAVDKNSQKVDWAAFGNCVDVVAPGEDIMSTSVRYLGGLDYSAADGTSLAAPMVTAEAALLKAKYPNMTNRQIIDTIEQTADNNPAYEGKLGHGLINIYKALSQPVFGSTNINSSVSSHPAGTVVLGTDKRTVYVMSDNGRRGFATPEEYNSHGFLFSDIVPANSADMALSQTEVVPFADGTLVLDTSDGRTIYMIDHGTKRGFSSAEVFTGLGYGFGKAVRGNLTNYPVGEVINVTTQPHPEGAIVRNEDKIYKIFPGGKKFVVSQDITNSWHWTDNKIVPANQADMQLPDLGVMPYRDGTLIKSSSGGIYLVSGGEFRPFASPDKLTQLGYKTGNAITISDGNFYMFKIGAVIN